MDDLVVVDCQYDFIDGTLACAHAREAVRYLVNFINQNDVRVLYTSDWHSPQNGSFEKNGGIWPVHCVAGTHGAEIAQEFTKDVERAGDRPSEENRFLKGKDDKVEEYSAFAGENSKGERLGDVVSRHVYVGGIASEYCVRETVLALKEAGHIVSLLVPGLGYVKKEDHEKNLEDLRQLGVLLIEQ